MRPYGQCAPFAIAIATQPMPSLTVSHHCIVQFGVRIASLDIILLDFDAIAGQFSVSVNDLAPGLINGSTDWLGERRLRQRVDNGPLYLL